MSLLSCIFRYFILLLSLVLPLSVVLFVFIGRDAPLVAVAVVFCFLAGLFLLSEKIVERSITRLIGRENKRRQASEFRNQGLKKSLVFACPTLKRLPKVLVFSDPTPSFVLARSCCSPGILFISKGLISILAEEELRTLLALANEKLRQKDRPLKTALAVLSAAVLHFAPSEWTRLILLGRLEKGPFFSFSAPRFAIFAALLPVAKFFTRLSGPLHRKKEIQNQALDAVQKIKNQVLLSNTRLNPGYQNLQLFHELTFSPVLSLLTPD
ncbi:MAG: hypothetical protein A3K03_07295 [Bdellovibrionales bacterium RIFOXYD1_FULL_44_7]|nr:MAG: hypothetical protein A3K03_07295 [Bdellovibrionales bacterium RIFOXYD1_FULL_44_7]